MKIILMLMLLGGGMLSSATVTLEQAVRDGLELAASVRDGRIDVENAERRLRLARSRFLPDLDAGGSWRFQSERMQLAIDPIIQASQVLFPGLERTVGTKHNWDLYLGLTQPIYTGGILSRRRDQAEARVEEESLHLRSARVERASAIRAAYYTHAMLEQRRSVAQQLAERLELHLQRLEALAAEEMARRSDVLETRSRLVDTQLNVNELDQAVAEAVSRFHELCGHYPAEIFAAADPRAFSREEAETRFLSRHPGLAALKTRFQQLDLEEKAVAGKYRPSVAAFAAFHLGRPGVDMFAADWMGYAVLGVSFSMPVFHWGRGAEERGLVRASARKLDYRHEALLRNVAHALDRLFDRLAMLERQVDELKKLSGLTSEDIRLKQALYMEKQISNLDYLAVLCEQEQVLSRLEAARYNLKLTQVAVHRAIGYMEEEQ
ncbi:MAG TPA: TolC family protein [Candidatus Aminicenantes bacterium]|nr:TolC family protein [Candidatus Aminicenantes bacterium]